MATDERSGQSYEEEHVHQVYQQIAQHFSSTRYKVSVLRLADLGFVFGGRAMALMSVASMKMVLGFIHLTDVKTDCYLL